MNFARVGSKVQTDRQHALSIEIDLREGRGVAMRAILGELLLLSCIALFIAGIVVALASLVI